MHCRFQHFSLVGFTLLLSLTSTLKLAGTPLGISAASAQVQMTQSPREEALRLNRGGLEPLNAGQFREALQTFQQVLGRVRAIGERQGEEAALNNIGLAYNNLGEYAQALQYFEQALVIAKQIADKAEEGITLNNIGGAYDSLGQYAQALKYYKQALAIRQQVGDKAGEGNTLNNIGLTYNNLGQYAHALKSYEQALAIRQQVGDKVGEGITLSNIGLAYNNQGEFAQALKSHEQALVIHKEVGDKAGEGTTLGNIGLAYLYLKQYVQALKYLEQALIVRQEVGDKAGEGIILNNIGGVYLDLEQYAQALKYLEQALVIHKEVGDKAEEGIILTNIGVIYSFLGQYPDAEKTLFAAIEVLESLRPGLTDANKVSIFETQAQTYRFLQQALVARNKTSIALEIAERGRARAFVELLTQRQSSNPNNQQPVKPPNIQQIQRLAKEQNATLVQYSIAYKPFKRQGKQKWRESELYIWVVRPTGEVAFKSVNLKSSNASLEDLVTSSRDSIGVRARGLGVTQRVEGASQANQLQQLHQLLIEPIAQVLPNNPKEHVIFIPQNELFLVPFPALKDASGKYLIEKHTILTAPAIQVLELTHKQRQQVAGTDVLVVGNPTMPSISFKIGEPPQQLPSLPGAETEAKAIASLFNTQPVTGNQATKVSILQRLTQARIVHLATHGLLDNFKELGIPGAIALAPSANDNGLLTSSEILDLKLNAELVVLSACDTGRGRITSDGVIGLSRSLISAGVPSVIVSLWSVPDAPTASLMTEFYRQIQQNLNKAQALRQAMLTTMKQYPDPKDWAAFTLIGEAE